LHSITSVSETIRKPAARQSLNCIKNKKSKIWRKTIFNMAEVILTPCNVACGSGVSVYFLNGTSAQEGYLVPFKVYMMDRI